MSREKRILGLIVLLAAGLRLFALGSDGLIGDEPAYSVRSIDYVDTLGTPLQTTPLDWFDVQPWWQKLSFHDHPPLVFMLQHVSQRIFGSGVAQARLPSALLDIGSVIVLFYIASLLFDKKTGLVASSLWAVNDFAIAYGRSSMMESVTLFFILLSTLIFLKALEDKKYVPWFGAAFGAAILAKYTAFFFLPVFAYVIYKKRMPWMRAMVPLLAVVSPVIIYNVMLYKTVGHFDVQIATLLKQKTQWLVLLGKEQRGSTLERLADMRSLFYYISPILFIVTIQAIGFFAIDKKKKIHFGWKFTTLMLLSSLVFVWFADTAGRFFFYSTVFMAMLAAAFVVELRRKFVIGAVIIFELLFAFNSIFANNYGGPYGYRSLTYASALERKDYGIFALNERVGELTQGRVSTYLPFNLRPSVTEFIQAKRSEKSGQPLRLIFIYDNTMGYQTYFWVFYRRLLQEGWPLLSSKQWNQLDLNPELIEQLQKDGELIYIHATDKTKRDDGTSDEFAQAVKQEFVSAEIVPDFVNTNSGDIAFEIYRAAYADIYGQ